MTGYDLCKEVEYARFYRAGRVPLPPRLVYKLRRARMMKITAFASSLTMQLSALLLCLFIPVLQILALPLNGADFSSLSLLESQGITYKDNGAEKPFEQILWSHGFELARIRVWTAGTYTQSYALALAKRAKAVGMKILIDLHYSDTCTWHIPTLTLMAY